MPRGWLLSLLPPLNTPRKKLAFTVAKVDKEEPEVEEVGTEEQSAALSAATGFLFETGGGPRPAWHQRCRKIDPH